MKPFDIFIAYIQWQNQGKSRPVLVLSQHHDSAVVYRITSKYENKSERIKACYFKINDWEYAGLDKPSYIDTFDKNRLPKSCFQSGKPIGRLSARDCRELTEFLLEKMQILTNQ
ncbi:MAG: type II toxin-antitoxin system PemK/MazF family toxin [Oscillospiraceae bacterium]|nr:type II toxin-antitoxin system PemK/MazF family toxin [Oscillospiraceae bacterium]